jgi:hypothetical protein
VGYKSETRRGRKDPHCWVVFHRVENWNAHSQKTSCKLQRKQEMWVLNSVTRISGNYIRDCNQWCSNSYLVMKSGGMGSLHNRK